MKRAEDYTIVDLSPEEVDWIAMRLTLDMLGAGHSDPTLEDAPMLAEAVWYRVEDAMSDYRRKLRRDLRQWEQLHDIDTVWLIEKAQA